MEPAVSSIGGQQSEIKLRSYQQEMLEASLEHNVIVAMDTGSGKTHVAIYRILVELERCGPSKLIWFLTPSVALSAQQQRVLSQHLPGYLVKLLTGSDGVDTWTDQRIWDAFLTNARVVVGTPKVLEDALTHGFVHISKIALLVFDEAHRCVKNGPMNVILKNFYHAAKANEVPIPSILGLTASPVMSTQSSTLEAIEANLDSRAITPKQHRSDLELYVHPPEVTSVIYENEVQSVSQVDSLLTHHLRLAYTEYDLSNDPYVLELREQADDVSQRQLAKIKEKPHTFCHLQLKTLFQRATALREQLGLMAAEWYLKECIARFDHGMASESLVLPDTTEKERRHLQSIFRKLSSAAVNDDARVHTGYSMISKRVQLLIDILARENETSLRAIVFVEQRVVVAALAHLLRSHPDTREAYSIGTFVGTSVSEKRKSTVADLVQLKEQERDLEGFRKGTKNLMIATSVLEEGIDISACNVVICLDAPKNLISFVQRRGRARQKKSKYIIFLPANDEKADPSKWQRLEAEMKEAYMNELRKFAPAEAPDEDDLSGLVYRIPSTGALLTLENAKAHLYHFCAVSTSSVSKYVDPRPEFSCDEVDGPHGRNTFAATVTLPSFVHPDIRKASSSKAWYGEAAAIKDAAFQAYVGLHEAGLVNDNLLPLTRDYGPDVGQIHVDQPSIVTVSERRNIWRSLCCNNATESSSWRSAVLNLSLDDEFVVSMTLWLPTNIPNLAPLKMYWNEWTTYTVEIAARRERIPSDAHAQLAQFRNTTRVLLQSVHGTRMPKDLDDFKMLFSPLDISLEAAGYSALEGTQPAINLLSDHASKDEIGLIRVKGQTGKAFFLSEIKMGIADADNETESQLVVTIFPKRKDFLHPVVERDSTNAAYTTQQLLSASECTVDNLSAKYALFAAFVPSITHRLEIALLARQLQTTTLLKVDINDTSLVIEAISAASAGEERDYNRLEFLGDSILKFCTVLQVSAKHLNWPEGYLDLEKDRIVCNKNLAKAAQNAGMDKYVLTKQFTGNKWRPVYMHELRAVSNEEAKRDMSSKMLADVVEALIGAAFIDGGLEKAYLCIQTLLLEEPWLPHRDALDELRHETGRSNHSDLRKPDQLTGHHFTNPNLLVEALTHVSFPYNRTGLSYERLEFLGDAVLDLIIVPKLFAHPRRLKHWELHRAREALVNAHFLGFCCMGQAVEEETFDVVPGGDAQPEVKPSSRLVHLHDFLRAGGQIGKAKREALDRFEILRGVIADALESSSEYPWSDLVAMGAPKFFSDIIESILGALFLDTHGDLSVCEAFVEKLGIMRYMQRILDENIETTHPKEMVGMLADRDEVQYTVGRSEADGEEKTFKCIVKVGGVEIARVWACGSKEEAKVRTAHQAVGILKEKTEVGGRKRKRDVIMHNRQMDDVEVSGISDIEGMP